MAKFTVHGKKVFVNDNLVKAFEKLEGGLTFDDNTAGYLLESGGGSSSTSSMEMTKIIEEGILDVAKMCQEISFLMPDIEKRAKECSEREA